MKKVEKAYILAVLVIVFIAIVILAFALSYPNIHALRHPVNSLAPQSSILIR